MLKSLFFSPSLVTVWGMGFFSKMNLEIWTVNFSYRHFFAIFGLLMKRRIYVLEIIYDYNVILLIPILYCYSNI